MLALLLALPALATAFVAPAKHGVSHAASAQLHAASKSLPFMEAPAALDGSMPGDVGFDPFGFSEIFDLKWLREAELKHGRVCMLAWSGFVATDLGFTLPGEMHKVSSVAAHDVATTYGAMQQLLLWIGLVETVGALALGEMMWGGSDREPGNFEFDPFLLTVDPVKKADLQLKEIVHCRLAMMAFSGVVTQAVLTGKGFPYF